MKRHAFVLRITLLLLFVAAWAVGATWIAARHYADKQRERYIEADRARGGIAVSRCRELTLAMLAYAARHGNTLPSADRWEDTLTPYLLGSPALPPAVDGRPRRFAMNRRLGGRKIESIPDYTRAVLFFESTSTARNTADDLASLPPENGPSGFAIGWLAGHCYYRPPEDRAGLIGESRNGLGLDRSPGGSAPERRTPSSAR
jgi:hypothetical protein